MYVSRTQSDQTRSSISFSHTSKPYVPPTKYWSSLGDAQLSTKFPSFFMFVKSPQVSSLDFHNYL